MRGRNMARATTWRAVPNIRSEEDSETGSYESYEAGAFLLDTEDTTTRQYIRPARAPYLSFDAGVASGDYELAEIYAMKKEDFRETNNSSGMKRWRRMTVACSNRFETAMEVTLRDALWSATNFTSGAWPAEDQFQLTSGDPFKRFRTYWNTIELASALIDTADENRHVWFNPTALNHLLSHAKLTRYYSKGESASAGTMEMLAGEIHVPVANIHVGRMVLNAVAPRATASNQRVWNAASLWMGYIPPAVTEEGDQTAIVRIWANEADAAVKRGEVDNGTEHYRWVRQAHVNGWACPDTTYGQYRTTVYA